MDTKMFSVKWMNSPNPDGVRPNSTMLPDNSEPDTKINTSLDKMAVGNIQSNRQPYAVQHLYTKYGELSTRLGTSMGS